MNSEGCVLARKQAPAAGASDGSWMSQVGQMDLPAVCKCLQPTAPAEACL